MILLLATMILLIGSVAATDTASNDTTHSSISTASSLQTTTASSEASDTDTVSEKITTPSTSDTSSTVSDENTVKTNSVTSTQSSSTVKNTTSVSSSDTNSNTQTKSLKSSNSSSSKTSTKMSVTNTTLYGYSNYTMKATVVDNSSKYVNSGTVAFKINGVTVGNTTVSNGKASYVYPLNGFSAGTYNITAIYSGTTKYSSASAAGTLNINKYDTKTTVTSVTGKSGSSVTLKAVITTSNGSYVKNGLVAFKINGNTVGYANVSNGGAKLDYIIPSTYGSTLYTVTAVYGGNNIYSSSKNNGNLTLTPTVESKITIKTTPVLAGKTTTIKAIITTNNGSYIKSGIVAFKINGKTIGYGTVSNGGASITYTIPSSYKDSTYTITAVYGGNGKYIASRANSTLTVLHKQTTSITV
ncbi:MAG: Ig-like domain-containing protein, partial [Methanosphaera sp.]|nr:Ig-like domain-containing protein [Methanosphaera sp.]